MDNLELQARQGLPGISRFFDGIVNGVRRRLTVERFERNSNLLTVVGHYSLIAIAALIVLFKVTIIVKFARRDTGLAFASLAEIAGWILFILVGHYLALKFLPRIQAMIRGRTAELHTPALADSIALVCLALAVAYVAFGLRHAFGNIQLGILLTILVSGLGFFYGAWLALNPDLTGTKIAEKAEPAQEALNVLGFLVNINFRAIPVFYGIGLVLSAVYLFAACLFLWMGKQQAFMHFGVSASTLVTTLLSPFGGFLAYIAINLFIDLLRSILRRA